MVDRTERFDSLWEGQDRSSSCEQILTDYLLGVPVRGRLARPTPPHDDSKPARLQAVPDTPDKYYYWARLQSESSNHRRFWIPCSIEHESPTLLQFPNRSP